MAQAIPYPVTEAVRISPEKPSVGLPAVSPPAATEAVAAGTPPDAPGAHDTSMSCGAPGRGDAVGEAPPAAVPLAAPASASPAPAAGPAAAAPPAAMTDGEITPQSTPVSKPGQGVLHKVPASSLDDKPADDAGKKRAIPAMVGMSRGASHVCDRVLSSAMAEAAASPPASGEVETQKKRMQANAARLLMHALRCSSNSCDNAACPKMKRAHSNATEHFAQHCTKPIDSCVGCRALLTLSVVHSKHCQNSQCPVAYCQAAGQGPRAAPTDARSRKAGSPSPLGAARPKSPRPPPTEAEMEARRAAAAKARAGKAAKAARI